MILKRFVVGELETNCYLYSIDDTTCCIIDPGAEGEYIAHAVEVSGLHLKAVIFTHGHFDHLLGAADCISYWKRKGITCPLYIHEKEYEWMGPGSLKIHSNMLSSIDPHLIPRYSAELSQIPQADVTLTDGERIPSTDLEVLHTPGHSPGSISLYSSKSSILFSGDTLFKGSVGRTDLLGGNTEELYSSLRILLSRIHPTTRVCPGHGPESKMGEEQRQNPYLNGQL